MVVIIAMIVAKFCPFLHFSQWTATMTVACNNTLCFIVKGVIHAAIFITRKIQVLILFTTETPRPFSKIYTNIPTLPPPTIVVTVVCHIFPVVPDVAIREITVSASCPHWEVDEKIALEVDEKIDPKNKQGHFTKQQRPDQPTT